MRSLLLVLLLSSSLPLLADGWLASKEQQGVTVYSRYSSGREFREYRGQVRVAARPDAVVRLLQDLAATPRWHYRTERVELLRSVDFTHALLHIFIRPPWPLAPRDVVVRAALTLQPKGRIQLSLKSTDAPKTPGRIRLPSLQANWLIEPDGDRGSRVTYRLYSEPGGSVPRWFYNSVAMDVPLYSLIRLRALLQAEE